MSADLLAVGVVLSPYGVHGEVKSRSFSGELGHFSALAAAVFRKGGNEKRLRIRSARPHPHGVVLKIEGVETPEQARKLVGFEIWVPREQAAPLADGEFYAADLCACSLWFNDELIGAVRSVWDGGPAQLLEVQDASGKTFLVPFTEHFVGDVDIARRKIVLKEDEIVR